MSLECSYSLATTTASPTLVSTVVCADPYIDRTHESFECIANQIQSVGGQNVESIMSSAPTLSATLQTDTEIISNHRNSAVMSNNTASEEPSLSGLPSENLVQEALNTFFTSIHQIPVFAFLHRASVMENFHAHSLDTAFLLALVGITSCYTDIGSDVNGCADHYIDTAEAMILRDLDRPTISKIQALIFVIKYKSASCGFGKVFILLAIAVRLATALCINYEDTKMSFLVRETRRRTMWSLYILDTVLAGGYHNFSLLPEQMLQIQLPCRETNFILNQPEVVEKVYQYDHENGLDGLALAIRAMRLRHRVLLFTKSAIIDTMGLESHIQSLQKDLDDFAARIPSAFVFSLSNARLHAYSTTLPVFATIHLVLQGAHCILFRLMMHGLKEALSYDASSRLGENFVTQCQQRCLRSAIAQANVVSCLLSLKTDTMLDIDLAVSAYQSLRIISHCYHTNLGDVVASELFSLGRQYRELFQRMFPHCEAMRRIRRDLEALIKRGRSPELSEREQDASDAGVEVPRATSTIPTHHVMSRHSVIGQMEIPDQDDNNLEVGNPHAPHIHQEHHALEECRDVGDSQTSCPDLPYSRTMVEHSHIEGHHGPEPSLLLESHDLFLNNSTDTMNLPLEYSQLQFYMDSSIWLPDEMLIT
jgi:hypothetical protein